MTCLKSANRGQLVALNRLLLSLPLLVSLAACSSQMAQQTSEEAMPQESGPDTMAAVQAEPDPIERDSGSAETEPAEAETAMAADQEAEQLESEAEAARQAAMAEIRRRQEAARLQAEREREAAERARAEAERRAREEAARQRAEAERQERERQQAIAALRAERETKLARIEELESQIVALQETVAADETAAATLQETIATARELLDVLTAEQAKYDNVDEQGNPVEPLSKDLIAELETRRQNLEQRLGGQ